MVEEVTLVTAPALVKIENPEAAPKLGKHCAEEEVRIPKKRDIKKPENKYKFVFSIINYC
jgi:hypothetical protein